MRETSCCLSDNNQADAVKAYTSTSRYLDDFLNIDNSYFEQIKSQMYPTGLQFYQVNFFDTTEAPFMELDLS